MKRLIVVAVVFGLVAGGRAATVPERTAYSVPDYGAEVREAQARQAGASMWFFASVASLGTAYYLDHKAAALRARADGFVLSDLDPSFAPLVVYRNRPNYDDLVGRQRQLRSRARDLAYGSQFFLVAAVFTAAFGVRDTLAVRATPDGAGLEFRRKF